MRACSLIVLCSVLAGAGLGIQSIQAQEWQDVSPRMEAAETEEASEAVPEPAPEPAVSPPQFRVAKLQGLNKITTRVSTLEAPLGTVVRFGNLEIIARQCWKSAPEEQPESAVLLDVWELKPDEKPQRIFLGWMFASSPAISALEHPVYDLTVLDCQSRALPQP